MKPGFSLLLPIAILAGAGGFFLAMKMAPPRGGEAVEMPIAPTAAELVGQPRPEFRHRDTAGRWVDAGDFDGQVLLVNFWATWCKPCVEEMPMLSGLQDEYGPAGLRIVGIAIDDAERARDFAGELDLAYPVLLGEADVVLTGRRYGNGTGMLPFSVLVDSTGIVRWSHLGALVRQDLEREIRDWL